uniref:Uncharacterized protein n=1 Tax=Nymphaea colorata TaxID=210225 RepID=A0A5K1DPI0_9MAGN
MEKAPIFYCNYPDKLIRSVFPFLLYLDSRSDASRVFPTPPVRTVKITNLACLSLHASTFFTLRLSRQ